ncbi:MAG: DUF779 domain-containing protein [Candidatus Nanopelagicales bacterium]|nr:DUF779 domain-containing protein [Candidatus Nanopelagicales bacterium]
MSLTYLDLPPRIGSTESANDLLRKLTSGNGPLMFHQSGGCCDGSSPMCYPVGEFRVGGADVLLGELVIDQIEEPIQVWISLEQFEYWKHTHITIDAVPGRGGGFSLETPEGLRFIIYSRIFTDVEWSILKDKEVLLGNGALKLV